MNDSGLGRGQKSPERGVQWSHGRLRTRPVALGKVRGITGVSGFVRGRGGVRERAYPISRLLPPKKPLTPEVSLPLALGSG